MKICHHTYDDTRLEVKKKDLLAAVNEASVDPTRHSVQLFPRTVGTLPGRPVISRPVERHVDIPALTFAVVHFVALFDLDAVDLQRATGLAGHQDLGRDHLTEEGQQRRAVPRAALRRIAVGQFHKELAEFPGAGSVRPGHHVDPVGVRGRRFAQEAAVDGAPLRVGHVVEPSVVALFLVDVSGRRRG